MISGGVAWTAALNSLQKQALYVLDIPGLSLAICSFDPSLITGGGSLYPIMQIPKGASQKVDELTGQSSISMVTVNAIDNGGQVKQLAANETAIGQVAYFKMGFPGLDLADFVITHTGRITTPGIARDANGWMVITVGDLLMNMVSDVFINGGPNPWTQGQAMNVFPPVPPALLDNGVPISNDNPRYISGNPIDIILAVMQNELGVGQATPPVLVPSVGSGSGTGRPGFAINPLWTMYDGVNPGTLLNPNLYLEVDDLLELKRTQFNGDRMEFILTGSQSGKTWLEDQINRVLGLYWVTKSNGKLTLKSLKHKIPAAPLDAVSWTNRAFNGSGLTDVTVIADGPKRIYIGAFAHQPGSSNGLVRSLLKADHSTYATHVTPGNYIAIASILPIDEDNVYMGNLGPATAAFFHFAHSTGTFTNLSWPLGARDGITAIHQMSNDADLLIAGDESQAAAGSQTRLYSYRISTLTYTHIGGFAAGGWGGAGGGNAFISSISENENRGLTVCFSKNAGAGAEIWDCDRNFTNWVRIAGAGEFGSWTAGTRNQVRAFWKTDVLYAGINGASAGDAEVWALIDGAWQQIGGDGIGGSWSGYTSAVNLTIKANALVVGLGGGSGGDSDVWMYDLTALTWTQIGGDSIDGSWSTLTHISSVHIDGDFLLWAGPSDPANNSALLYSTLGPFGRRLAPLYDADIRKIDQSQIMGIPQINRWPVINMINTTLPGRADGGSGGSGGSYPISFVQQASIDNYKATYMHSLDSTGLRLGLGGYTKLFLLANRIFARHAFATPEYTVRTFLKNFVLELGEYFLLSHPNLLDLKTGLMGVTNILVEIVDRDPDYAGGFVTFKVIDTRFISPSNGAFVIGDPADWTPTWVDARRVNRQCEVFISDDDGLMADGRPGNQIS